MNNQIRNRLERIAKELNQIITEQDKRAIAENYIAIADPYLAIESYELRRILETYFYRKNYAKNKQRKINKNRRKALVSASN